MKDFLSGYQKWWNLPMMNPTQNMFRRGLKMPTGNMETFYTRGVENFQQYMNRGLKTRYLKYLSGNGGGE